MTPSPESKETISRFERLLVALAEARVDFAYLSPQDLIFLKQDSWRDKDKLDVRAMQEIVRRENEAGGKPPGA